MPSKKTAAVIITSTVIGSSALGILAWQAIDDDTVVETPTTTQSVEAIAATCQSAMRNSVSVLNDGIDLSDAQKFDSSADFYRRAADLLVPCVQIPGASEHMQTVIDQIRLAADDIENGDVAASDAHFSIANDEMVEVTKYIQPPV